MRSAARLLLLLPALGLLTGCCCCLGCPGPSATNDEPSPTTRSAKPPQPAPVTATPPSPAKEPVPRITTAVGLGDAFSEFRTAHGPCTGPSGSPLKLSPDGSASLVFCDRNYYMLTAIEGVVQNVTLQYEARGSLPRRQAEETALAHAPSDRKKVRTFTNGMGETVTVYTSSALADNLPAPVWYGAADVGTFSVALQNLPGESTFFGARLFTGGHDPEDSGL